MDILKFGGAHIISSASVVGSTEEKGPLGGKFDLCDTSDDTFGKDTWEKAESEMQRLALKLALEKASLVQSDVNAVLAGDLINQCIASSHGIMDFGIPEIGLFGACSTCAESILLASVFSAYAKYICAAVTSSHNCTAERQFRFPVEYAALRTPTSQWTVTGAGAFVISPNGKKGDPEVTEGVIGRIVDSGLDDLNNMGAAMAPAAADTLKRYFSESGRAPESFDYIVTGDLGLEGSAILCELMKADGCDISSRHTDCGIEIYDIKNQDMHSGGSGCGCSAAVMSAYFLDRMRKGEIRDMLFVGTGALMNAMSVQQGNTIPAAAHLVRISAHER